MTGWLVRNADPYSLADGQHGKCTLHVLVLLSASHARLRTLLVKWR